jgi:hypothetical protein
LKIWAGRKTGEFSRGLPVTYSRHDGEQTKTQPLKKAGVNPSPANRYEAIANVPEAIANVPEVERKEHRFGQAPHDAEPTKTQPLKKAGVNPHHANRFEAIADIPQQVKGCPGRETEKGVKKPASLEDLGAKLILHKIFDSTLSFVSINLAWPNIKLRWSVYQRRVCLRLFGL